MKTLISGSKASVQWQESDDPAILVFIKNDRGYMIFKDEKGKTYPVNAESAYKIEVLNED